jgi:transcription-repair coupling factor (superfamily II helicase)
VSAYVPADYIAWEATKIDVHRRLARARDERELVTLGEELADRFGPPPGPVVDLLALQAVRLKAAAAGATAVGWRSGRLSVDGLELADEEAARLRQLNDRAVHLKARAALAVHPPADLAAALAASPRRRAAASTAPAAGAAADALSAPGSATHKAPAPLLAWVLTVLDAILAARSANAAVPEKGI